MNLLQLCKTSKSLQLRHKHKYNITKLQQMLLKIPQQAEVLPSVSESAKLLRKQERDKSNRFSHNSNSSSRLAYQSSLLLYRLKPIMQIIHPRSKKVEPVARVASRAKVAKAARAPLPVVPWSTMSISSTARYLANLRQMSVDKDKASSSKLPPLSYRHQTPALPNQRSTCNTLLDSRHNLFPTSSFLWEQVGQRRAYQTRQVTMECQARISSIRRYGQKSQHHESEAVQRAQRIRRFRRVRAEETLNRFFNLAPLSNSTKIRIWTDQT